MLFPPCLDGVSFIFVFSSFKCIYNPRQRKKIKSSQCKPPTNKLFFFVHSPPPPFTSSLSLCKFEKKKKQKTSFHLPHHLPAYVLCFCPPYLNPDIFFQIHFSLLSPSRKRKQKKECFHKPPPKTPQQHNPQPIFFFHFIYPKNLGNKTLVLRRSRSARTHKNILLIVYFYGLIARGVLD